MYAWVWECRYARLCMCLNVFRLLYVLLFMYAYVLCACVRICVIVRSVCDYICVCMRVCIYW
jgi:hypothetical protein